MQFPLSLLTIEFMTALYFVCAHACLNFFVYFETVSCSAPVIGIFAVNKCKNK